MLILWHLAHKTKNTHKGFHDHDSSSFLLCNKELQKIETYHSDVIHEMFGRS